MTHHSDSSWVDMDYNNTPPTPAAAIESSSSAPPSTTLVATNSHCPGAGTANAVQGGTNVWINSVGAMEQTFLPQSLPAIGLPHRSPYSSFQSQGTDQEFEWISPWQTIASPIEPVPSHDCTLMRRHSMAHSISDVSVSEVLLRPDVSVRGPNS